MAVNLIVATRRKVFDPMSNNKLARVNPSVVVAPYVRGTEAGHFYLVTNETPDGSIIGFRPLNVDYAQVGDVAVDGVSTRVRVVPVAENPKLDKLMTRLGFSKRQYGNGDPVHYSITNSTPRAALADAELALSLFE